MLGVWLKCQPTAWLPSRVAGSKTSFKNRKLKENLQFNLVQIGIYALGKAHIRSTNKYFTSSGRLDAGRNVATRIEAETIYD